jgi:hypothetical protein
MRPPDPTVNPLIEINLYPLVSAGFRWPSNPIDWSIDARMLIFLHFCAWFAEGDSDMSDGLKVVGGTDSGKQPGKGRRPLTSKQQAFADGVVSGLSQSEAYRRAYSAEGMKPSAVHTEASALAGHPEVARRIAAGLAEKERAAQRSGLSRRAMVLERLEHEAMNAEADAARIRALELLGKHERLFVDVVENQEDTRTADDLREELAQRLAGLTARVTSDS